MIYSVDTFPGRTILVNGKNYLYFGGTSYLGLQTDAGFQEIFVKNVKKYGTNYGASRKANVQISAFDKAENYLAKLVGSESSVTMSSGYLAGQLVAQTLDSSFNEFFYAPESHSAVHIPRKQPYHTFDDLNKALRAHLKSKSTVPVVFMDSIDLQGRAYPYFEAVQRLPLKEVILVLDDSHGIGIVGEKGGGVYKKVAELNPKELLVCCSLGKGFGIQAGAILGTTNRIAQFKNTDFFGGASPASPANMATLIAGESIFEEKRKILKQNIRVFLSSLKNPKVLTYLENYPAFYFSNARIASVLEENDILTTNFNYPNEESPLMRRIVLSAAHTKEDITFLAKLLNSL